MAAVRNIYDHRFRAYIVKSGDIDLAYELGVPRSTLDSWFRRGVRNDVVELQGAAETSEALLERARKLEKRNRILRAVVLLLVTLVRFMAPKVDMTRVPDAKDKRALLRAFERASRVIPRNAALRILRITEGRMRAWSQRAVLCTLDDRPTCPRSTPTRLTRDELLEMKNLVQSEEHRHFSIHSLALFAQRTKRVFANAGTWSKYVRERGWRRPTRRVHPVTAKVGIRATRPNEIWHCDVTVLRLLDGTRAYVQAILDNYSRRILAYRVSTTYDGAATAELLVEAARSLPELVVEKVQFLTDAGVENINHHVAKILEAHPIRHVIAQIDILQSNSLIEALWRSMKHRYLFLNKLDSFDALKPLVAFFVEQHNGIVPHSAFAGQTPDEMYFGTAPDLPTELAGRRAEARRERLLANKNTSCGTCRPTDTGASIADAGSENLPSI